MMVIVVDAAAAAAAVTAAAGCSFPPKDLARLSRPLAQGFAMRMRVMGLINGAWTPNSAAWQANRLDHQRPDGHKTTRPRRSSLSNITS